MTEALNVFRWFVLCEAMFAFGTLIALYQRLWRYTLPAFACRLMILAGAITDFGFVVGVRDRLHDPWSYRDAVAVSALTLYGVALVTLYHWTRIPEGRKARHESIARYNAWRLLRADEQREHDEHQAAKQRRWHN